jgi:Na+/phosphate symporter
VTSQDKSRRWRAALVWSISAALLIGYAFMGEERDNSRQSEGRQLGQAGQPIDGPQLPDEERGREIIEVTDVRPAEAAPGSAIEVDFVNTFTKRDRPLQAWLSVTDYRAGRQQSAVELEVMHASEGRLVVRVPQHAFEGRAKLRVGYDKEDRSKPYDLRIINISYRKIFREVLGGLALLFFGLRVMSRGSRQYTGDRSQGLLAQVGKSSPAALGLGVAVGGITQFTTTAAGLVVGLIESHLLAVAPAVVVLLGAQLGAAVTPSVLGLISTREGLLVITIGVLWLSFASDRRSEAFGKIILGCGLLFFGLHLLRQGFEPLVSNPDLIPYIDHFHASTVLGRLWCLLAGVLLTAILQGPAPVFVFVLSLAQTSGRIDLTSALAILAGTTFGGAIGTQMVASPFGAAAGRVARMHLLLGLVGTLILALTADLQAGLADAIMPGVSSEISYGTKVLLPKMGQHLVAGFAIGQAVITLLLVALVPVAMRLLDRRPTAQRRRTTPLVGNAGVEILRHGLAGVLEKYRTGLGAIYDLCSLGQRRRGSDGEHLLADTRQQIEVLFSGALLNKSLDPDLAKLRQATLAVIQLQRALEELLHHAERSAEQTLALSPAGEGWQLPPQDAATIKTLHAMLLEGIDVLTNELRTGATPDLDAARAREIRLNAAESESRQGLLVDADRGESSSLIALRLNSSELVNAYETVGNHLYRLNEALGADIDQETPGTSMVIRGLS